MAFRTRKNDGKVTAVVGGQFGSEGKGTVVHFLADEYDVHVRTGGPNAGHSFWYEGRVWKHQQLPCGWTNERAMLVLGAGALIDPLQLKKELDLVREVDGGVLNRLLIDAQAHLIERRHHDEEGGVDGELHARIGSTGEGVGAARIARIQRDSSKIRRVVDALDDYPWLNIACMEDTAGYLTSAVRMGHDVLLEGTQGSGLSLIHGPWPYVTSADTNAAQMAADCGLPPQMVREVVLVVRSHPIRVAGNSGPLKDETSWEELSQRLGKDVIERTTVTHKVRRVGEWDEALVSKAVNLNDPTSIALTFADYINPDDEGVTDFDRLSRDTRAFVYYLEQMYETPVSFIGVGGEGWPIIDRRGSESQ